MTKPHQEATIYTRDQHSISRNDFSQQALDVLYGLHKAGYRALLVGGCLRDILRGKQPKDFDVVTDATPEQIKTVFKNCRLIGRRFRLAHIYFGREIIEVATFRANEKGVTDSEGRVLNHNSFGTIETDVSRRDFTINALYYDIADFSIIDFVGAMSDIDNGIIRMIGEPKERYAEDPVRILRASRFAAKLDMRLETEVEKSIAETKHLLQNIPASRLFDEVGKLFMSGHAVTSYEELKIHDLFSELFPVTDDVLKDFSSIDADFYKRLIKKALKNTDYRVKHEEPVTIAFLLAVFLWPLYDSIRKQKSSEGANWFAVMHETIDIVFLKANERVGIPMRHKTMIRDIWVMQSRLIAKTNSKRIESALKHKRFRAGFDFLELRLQSGESELESFHALWAQAQIDTPEAMYVASEKKKRPFKKRRRRK